MTVLGRQGSFAGFRDAHGDTPQEGLSSGILDIGRKPCPAGAMTIGGAWGQ